MLLKCLEGETRNSAAQQLGIERLLPTIDHNVKNGNSLIDWDYQREFSFSQEEKAVIKPFQWEVEFETIMKAGGFHAVIGNPPWVSLSGRFGNEILPTRAIAYLIAKYQGNTAIPNLYEYFVRKGLDLVRPAGTVAMIVPDRLGFNVQFIGLRKRIASQFTIRQLIYKAPFPGITTDTLIFDLIRETPSDNDVRIGEYGHTSLTKPQTEFLQTHDYAFGYDMTDAATSILNKVFTSPNCRPLGEMISSTSGFGGKSALITKARASAKQLPILKGRSIQPYEIVQKFFFDFQPENITGRTTDRAKLGASPKVLLRKTGLPLFAAYDESGAYPEQSLYFLFDNRTTMSLKYFTALLNSQVFNFVYQNRLVTNKNSTPQLKKVDLDRFPIRVVDTQNTVDKKAHDDIVNEVDKLLKLQPQLAATTVPTQQIQLQRELTQAKRRINQLVYDLYNLSQADIDQVEALLG